MSSQLSQYLPLGLLILILLSIRPTQPSIRNFAVVVVGAGTSWIALPAATSPWSRAMVLILVLLAFGLSPFMSPTCRAARTAAAHIRRWARASRDGESEGQTGSHPENPEAMILLHDPGDEANVDIVAVHGLASSVETTWTHKISRKHWLKEFLPRPDQLPKYKIRARIMVFRHNSGWSANALVKDLPDYGRQLLSALRAERRAEKAKDRPLLLIGHSFGGLLIEQALVLASRREHSPSIEQQNKLLTDSLAGIIFLGTPHGGSDYGILARMYCVFRLWDGASTALLRYLDPESEKARELQTDFSAACPGLPTMDYFESKRNSVLGYGVNLIVDKKAATRPNAPSEPLDTDHFGLNKFESATDASYKTIRAKIVEMVEDKIDKDKKQAGKNGPDSSDVLDWLLRTDPRPPYPMTLYEDRLEKLLIPIGQRLLGSLEFKQWYNGEHGWLWCHGMPGAGKTSLATIIIKYLLDERKNHQRNIGVACLYCVHSDRTQSAINFVRNILHQLLKQSRNFSASSLVSLYQSHMSASPPTSPSLEDYEVALEAEINHFETVYLVVDALDECRKDDAKEFQAYSDTRSRFLQTLGNLGSSVRLLVTSRDNELRTSRPRHAVTFRTMEVSATEADIMLYIERRIESTPGVSELTAANPELKSEMKETISKKAAGMFLPAQLYMNFLARKAKDRRINPVLKALRNLPTFRDKALKEAYTKAYADILKDIWADEDDAERATKTLAWVMFAKDPLNLTIDMVKRALTIEDDVDMPGAGPTEGDSDCSGDQTLEANILSACRGLVTVDHQSRNLRFVHFTAEEYFSDPEVREGDKFRDSEEQIATACMTSILCNHRAAAGHEQLFRYASRYWGYHAWSPEGALQTQIRRLLGNREKLRDSFQLVCDALPQNWGRRGAGVEAVHVAAYFGLKSTMSTILETLVDIDVKDASGWTALRWAMISPLNPDRPVDLLLQHGADVLSQDLDKLQTIFWAVGERPVGATKIEVRVRNEPLSLGDVSTVTTGQSFATAMQSPPLARTSPRIIQRLVEKLPSNSLDVRRRPDGPTLLSVVALNWQWEAVCTLLRRGANKNAKDSVGTTPLLWALRGPRFKWEITQADAGGRSRFSVGDITRVDPAVEISIDDSDYSEQTFEQYICQLIGDDVDATDDSGRTALSLAVENRFHSVAHELLQGSGKKANPNTADDEGMTPLHWACSLPRFQTVAVRQLLCRGRSRVRLGMTTPYPLASVTKSERCKEQPVERTVELLLRCGAEVGAENGRGQTALELAVLDGLESHARLLQTYTAAYRDGRLPRLGEVSWAGNEMQRRDRERILVAMLDRRPRFLLTEVKVEERSCLLINSTPYISHLQASDRASVVIADRPYILQLTARDRSRVVIRATVSTGQSANRRTHDDPLVLSEFVTGRKGQATVKEVTACDKARVDIGADAQIDRVAAHDGSSVRIRGRSLINHILGSDKSSLLLGATARIAQFIAVDCSSILVNGDAEVSELRAHDNSRVVLMSRAKINELTAFGNSMVLSNGRTTIRKVGGWENASLAIMHCAQDALQTELVTHDRARAFMRGESETNFRSYAYDNSGIVMVGLEDSGPQPEMVRAIFGRSVEEMAESDERDDDVADGWGWAEFDAAVEKALLGTHSRPRSNRRLRPSAGVVHGNVLS